jgi:ArsR family transcriptional regulator, arsenate/arsenite/antimonite-responsive transcriptional repressor
MNSPAQVRLEQRAELFKALGHPVRLLILNLIRVQPRHGEELASILSLTPATISHHLSALTAAGLLTARKDQYYQIYSLVDGPLNRTLADLINIKEVDMNTQVEEDAYRDKVLRTFMRNGRLLQIPAQLKKWQVILAKVVELFEFGRTYTEKEVNFILLDVHEDVASLRRGMIEEGLMVRDHGIYQRVEKASPAAQE